MKRRSMRVDARRQNLQNILFSKSYSRTTIIPESPMVTSIANCSEKMSILETPDTVSKNYGLKRILQDEEAYEANSSKEFVHTPDIICDRRKSNLRNKSSLRLDSNADRVVKSARSISPSKLILPFDINDKKTISKKLNNLEATSSPRNNTISRRETRSPVFRRSLIQANCNMIDKTIKNKISKAIGSLSLSNHSIPTSPHTNSDLLVQGKSQPGLSFFEFPKSPKFYCNTSRMNIPETQPASSLILDGIVAYVDVRSGNDNRSLAIKEFAKSIGADIAVKFTSNVTHLIFKEGSKSMFERATQRGIHMVSTLWLNACQKEQKRVPESLFPAKFKSKDTIMQARYRKQKSMQPLSFEEQEELADARLKKRIKSSKCISAADEPSSMTPLKVKELQHVSSRDAMKDFLSPKSGMLSVSTTDDSMDSNEEMSTPLRERMFQRIFKKRPPLRPLTTSANLSPISTVFDGASNSTSEWNEKSLNSRAKENTPEKVANCEISRRKSRRLAELSEIRCNGSNLFNASNLRLSESPANHCGTSVNNQHTDMDLTDGDDSVFNGKAKTSQLDTRAAAPNVAEIDTLLFRSGAGGRSSARFRHNISSQCVTNSVSSSISLVKKHRLHTVDICQPTQDLIYPITPNSPDKLPSSLYDSLLEKKSQVSTKLVKNGPKTQGKNLRRLSSCKPIIHENEPSASSTIANTSGHSNAADLSIATDESRDTSHNSLQTSELQFKPPTTTLAAPRKRRPRNVSIIPKSRQSLDEFIPRKSVKRLSCSPKKEEKSATICFTSVKSCDMPSLMAIVHKLKGYRTVKSVTTSTTHVVCGLERRTLNVLRGIAKGCWIVDVSWLFESLDLDQWANEEPFELFNFCPGAKVSRIAKSAESQNDKGFLCDFGTICISGTTEPPASDLKAILKNLGAIITSTTQHADLIIGRKVCDRNPSALYVHEKWLLDCIQFWKAFPPDKYQTQE